MNVIPDVTANAGPAGHTRPGLGFPVAIVALHFGMRPIQGKPRLGVIEIPRLPGTGVMAEFALLPETSFVLVVLFVARETGQWRVLEGRCQVAFLALNLGMTAGQRETGELVIEGRARPLLFVVTGFALVAKLPLMLVVLLVTSNTRIFQLALVDITLLRQVATITLGLPMLALEQILGFLVMIEGAALPILGGMAGSTFIAVAALVALFVVIFAVTGNALGVDFQVPGIVPADTTLVAGFAFGILVLVAQRELGVVVVKRGGLPASLAVATLALFP